MFNLQMSINKNDLARIMKITGNLKAFAVDVQNKLIRELANEFVTDIRQNIMNQTFGNLGYVHSKDWAKRKAREGKGAGKYWLHTGKLLKSVRARKITTTAYWVGIDAKGGKGGNPRQYGAVVEKGNYYNSSKAKPRPLWYKTFTQFKKKWNAKLKSQFIRVKGTYY
jgi:hypothetical protein